MLLMPGLKYGVGCLVPPRVGVGELELPLDAVADGVDDCEAGSMQICDTSVLQKPGGQLMQIPFPKKLNEEVYSKEPSDFRAMAPFVLPPTYDTVPGTNVADADGVDDGVGGMNVADHVGAIDGVPVAVSDAAVAAASSSTASARRRKRAEARDAPDGTGRRTEDIAHERPGDKRTRLGCWR